MRRLRIALIASARFPIREPFAGGLEAHTWVLARGLKRRGHRVTVFAGAGCDPELGVRELRPIRPWISDGARADVSMPARAWLDEHHAYLQLLMELVTSGRADFDVVHNNCLHYLPLAMARLVPVPMISTLHTPPTPWLESAVQAGPCPVVFTAVSRPPRVPGGMRSRRSGLSAMVSIWPRRRPGPGVGAPLWGGPDRAREGPRPGHPGCPGGWAADGPGWPHL